MKFDGPLNIFIIATSSEAEKPIGSTMSNSNDAPLKSIIETPLTEALVNELFHQQDQDGSFPATESLGKVFNVDFERIKQQLNEKGLQASISDEVYRLISTASVLFYFLYNSQKAKFPIDIATINELVAKARSELESLSLKDDPIVQTYIDKGELAVKFVISTRQRHDNVCAKLKLPQTNWESYIQTLMGLEK
ncbi:unnamed protein product [Rotaria socialis]|uniref:PARP4 MVP-ID C-terminal domain-containing protein n=2 Tax=Rotaria socialis TaxID=392032 RepID=A0A818UTN7_9BILA|nr:unnamed protein product [Rotaria socialis]